MQLDQLEKAYKAVLGSEELSAQEKTEWLQLLPEMSPKQLVELIAILTPKPKPVQETFVAKKAPVAVQKPKVQEPAPIKKAPAPPKAPVVIPPKQVQAEKPAWKLPVDLSQKDLETSIPEYELELPAAHQTTPMPVAVNQSPEDLQKKVESIIDKMSGANKKPLPPAPTPQDLEKLLQHTEPIHPVEPVVVQPLVTPKPPEIVRPEPSPQPAPVAVAARPEVFDEPLALATVDDLAKLTPSALRKDPVKTLQLIYEAVARFCKKHPGYAVVDRLESSRLYKAYVQTGIRMLNDTDSDRDKAYSRMIAEMQKNNQDYLTKQ